MAVVIRWIRQWKDVKGIVGNMGICRKCERFCGFYIPNTYSRFPPILFVREYVVMKWLQGQGVQGGNNILMEMCIKVPKKEEVLYIIVPPLQGTLLRRKMSFSLLLWGRLPPEHLLVESNVPATKLPNPELSVTVPPKKQEWGPYSDSYHAPFTFILMLNWAILFFGCWVHYGNRKQIPVSTATIYYYSFSKKQITREMSNILTICCIYKQCNNWLRDWAKRP